MIALELIHLVKKKKKEKVFLFKLDFGKAFDYVSWAFIKVMMRRMGFYKTWINWMLKCMSSVKVSIILSGIPSLPFDVKHAVNQWDPLFLFHFVIAIEALKCIVDKWD